MLAEAVEKGKEIRFLHDFDEEKSKSYGFISDFLKENNAWAQGLEAKNINIINNNKI